MRYSLRRTTAHLHLTYGGAESGEALIGRRFTLEIEGNALTLLIDLTPNFQTRNKMAASYLDATALVRNHDRLRSLQCDDNLVRTRLVRTWEDMHEPSLKLVLDLGLRGHFVYAVRPHLLFTGGVQLDVLHPLDASAYTPHDTEVA
ncbi:hypothetical protein [Ramlibacter rhizophilus]|uniref:Uncharacterized protein n=1 Tax=Ramlibacter rhizophilus TaxID=1781167 RepID=A0A4Z0BJW7_9BURK|nr:hypothetical protein [Ramlibacter rhizophilus]TFY99586.1 hypothetical protein EZ242_10565 [Ramlibacter rhizophilus]